jgi:hypothetical protein
VVLLQQGGVGDGAQEEERERGGSSSLHGAAQFSSGQIYRRLFSVTDTTARGARMRMILHSTLSE